MSASKSIIMGRKRLFQVICPGGLQRDNMGLLQKVRPNDRVYPVCKTFNLPPRNAQAINYPLSDQFTTA